MADSPLTSQVGLASMRTVNRFRAARGRILHKLIRELSSRLGRNIKILDVGGRPDYWINVGFDNISTIYVLNNARNELDVKSNSELPPETFVAKFGDARDLSNYSDGSIDLVHANSVIEHVGGWDDMAAMARELMRVGRAGWVQTPAWGFPFEPHFRVPFAHWFSRPIQARMLSLSLFKAYRIADSIERRRHVERINLLTRKDVEALFPRQKIHVERIVVPKSYSVYWCPDGISVE